MKRPSYRDQKFDSLQFFGSLINKLGFIIEVECCCSRDNTHNGEGRAKTLPQFVSTLKSNTERWLFSASIQVVFKNLSQGLISKFKYKIKLNRNRIQLAFLS